MVLLLRELKKNADWLASGRGIPLLNKIGDRLDYCRTEQQQNCLIIVKKTDQRSEQREVALRGFPPLSKLRNKGLVRM